MAYPGNRELSIEAQDRVMSAFRKVIANLQQRQREEALIGLEFVLRIDPAFTPGIELQRQLESGAEAVDLSDLIAQLEAPSTDAINELLVDAVEEFGNRNFVAAKSKVEQVLMELPGHQEGRRLLAQIQESLKVEQQVGQFLTQAREALAAGDPQEAANFVLMAQALDPHHTGIAPTLQQIQASSGGAAQPQPEFAPAAEPPQWDAGDDADDLFGGAEMAAEFPPASFDLEAEPLTEPLETEDRPADDDVADLFVSAAGGEHEAGSSTSDAPAAVADLLARGKAAFEDGRFLAAIDAWSRVWLEDPTNEEVGPRILDAKKRLEASAGDLQRTLFEAEDALIGGDDDRALALVEQVLAKNPAHREALALHRRLKGESEAKAAAAPPPRADQEMPDLDDDLFSAPFGDQPAEAAEELGSAFDSPLEIDNDVVVPAPRRRLLAVSPRMIAVGGLALAVVAVAGFLGLRALLGLGEPTAANDVYLMRQEAEALFAQGKPAAALHMVEGFEPGDEGEQQVVAILLAKYRAALATPTPTPVPAAAIEAQRLMEAGLWFHAYDVASAGLDSSPGDGGLLDIVDRAEAIDPRVETLRTQLINRNHRAAVNTVQDMLEAHPGQADLTDVLERSLFNAALAELRTYNLTGAKTYLDQFVELEPGDEEVDRVLEFINTYKARPADMQLKVFIQSLDERLAWSVLPAATPSSLPPEPAVTEPDATATPTAA